MHVAAFRSLPARAAVLRASPLAGCARLACVNTTTSSAAAAVSSRAAFSTYCLRPRTTAVASRTAAARARQPSSHSAFSVRGYASDSYPPHTVLNMPALSPTMTAGNLGQWAKKIGDEIVPGDVLIEVETDKATMDFECQDEGFLAKIFVESGEKDVPVGRPIGVLVESKDDIEKFADFKPESAPAAPAKSKEKQSTDEAKEEEPKEEKAPKEKESKEDAAKKESAPAKSSSSDRVKASPMAKTLAAEKGIDLSTVKGTGPDGRIVKEDILNYKAPAAAAPSKAASSGKGAPAAAPGAAYVDIPLSNVRKVIASRLLESKQTIPHYYLTQEINVDKILKLREVLNSQANGKYKLSVNDFVIKASALALKAVPEVNSSWQGSTIRQFNNADIAVAVATDNGLITPIVTSAEHRGLSTISTTVKELAARARINKLQPNEYQGGTFTISNLGMYGISHFTAIINPPHSSILAVGGATDKLVLDDAEERGFRNTKVMNVTLSCDHRVVDGAVGSKWLGVFKGLIENPLTMLL
ncbi:pyruvate dehydrogenase complex dihydrolipoamide acetyltransferase component (E2) [Geranomyces variabilis]|uniref:Acetyltransferase component of pyruvate dehydrogenase complex n=1 Tax=Geranomyces variabilis TaxID=109894 RepID=A0AAD5XQ24_9FUNG|nr:pyruvate dehydrogenase complex dihydrolipoamide acetyltransferase component (E2) [Geranomyces variabilis]